MGLLGFGKKNADSEAPPYPKRTTGFLRYPMYVTQGPWYPFIFEGANPLKWGLNAPSVLGSMGTGMVDGLVHYMMGYEDRHERPDVELMKLEFDGRIGALQKQLADGHIDDTTYSTRAQAALTSYKDKQRRLSDYSPATKLVAGVNNAVLRPSIALYTLFSRGFGWGPGDGYFEMLGELSVRHPIQSLGYLLGTAGVVGLTYMVTRDAFSELFRAGVIKPDLEENLTGIRDTLGERFIGTKMHDTVNAARGKKPKATLPVLWRRPKKGTPPPADDEPTT